MAYPKKGEYEPVTLMPCGTEAISTGQKKMQEFETVISFEELYKGLKRSQRNVMWKDSVAGYSLNGLKNTYKLRQELLAGKYQISQYQRFKVHEPKERDILATRVKDRQFQSSLCKNALYPQITKGFIKDNCACQKKKGNDYALNRLVGHLRSYYRKHGNKGWVLQCDIKRFFPSTPQNVAEKKVCEAVKNSESAAYACAIIESFCEPIITDKIAEYVEFEPAMKAAHSISAEREKRVIAKILKKEPYDENKFYSKILETINKLPVEDNIRQELYDFSVQENFNGIGLGSEVSQLVQLLILNDLDHFIKERLLIKNYERYMDDFVLIHTDKKYLKECLAQIELKVKELGLELNRKTTIYKLEQGVHFLKWRLILTDTGKVVKKMNPKRVSKERRKLRKLKAKVETGEITMRNVRDNFQSWQADAEWGDTKSVVWDMRKYYISLFKEVPPYGKFKRHESGTNRKDGKTIRAGTFESTGRSAERI